MKLELDANDAVSILIEMTAESIATSRLLIEAICELTNPDDEVGRLAALAVYTRRAADSRKAILHNIYEHRGKINLDDIGLSSDTPPENP